jgi:hypothetical protein
MRKVVGETGAMNSILNILREVCSASHLLYNKGRENLSHQCEHLALINLTREERFSIRPAIHGIENCLEFLSKNDKWPLRHLGSSSQ